MTMNIRSMTVTFTDHAGSQTLAWKVQGLQDNKRQKLVQPLKCAQSCNFAGNFQGLVDLWVMGIYGDFILHGLFILNSCMDLL